MSKSHISPWDDDSAKNTLRWCRATLTLSFYRLVLTLLVIVCFVFRWGPTRVLVRQEWMHTGPGGTFMTPRLRFSAPWTRAPSACKWAPTRERARYCNTFLVARKSEIAGLEWKSFLMAPLFLCPHVAAVYWGSCVDLHHALGLKATDIEPVYSAIQVIFKL